MFLPGESHGQRSLAGYNSPWGRTESHMTEMTYHAHSPKESEKKSSVGSQLPKSASRARIPPSRGAPQGTDQCHSPRSLTGQQCTANTAPGWSRLGPPPPPVVKGSVGASGLQSRDRRAVLHPRRTRPATYWLGSDEQTDRFLPGLAFRITLPGL